MNYLLDTHVFIWMNEDLDKLSEAVQNIVSDEKNTLFLSVISIWEIQIKLQIGKFSKSRFCISMLGSIHAAPTNTSFSSVGTR